MKSPILLATVAAAMLLPACSMGRDDTPHTSEIKAAMNSGDLAKARRMIALAHGDGADSAALRILGAELALARGDGIGAATNIYAAQRSGAEEASVLPLLAEAYARQGKFDEALASAEQVADDGLLSHIKGLQHKAQDNPWEAREALEAAFAQLPENSRLAIDVARARSELGLYPEAREAISHVIKSQPKNMLAPLTLGMVEMEARRFDAAKRAYDAALKLAPGSADALIGSARALYAGGDYNAAKKAVIALPKDIELRPETQLLAAKIATRKKDYKAARTHFSNAGDLAESDAEAQFLLATIHVKNSRPYKAIRLLELAVEARPDLPEYHAALIRAYRETGDEAAAARKKAKVPASLQGAEELRGL